jgi:hypothetical protein
MEEKGHIPLHCCSLDGSQKYLGKENIVQIGTLPSNTELSLVFWVGARVFLFFNFII